MSEDVKLTKLAACAGCGAKVGAGELAKLFEGFEQPRDPNLLVGLRPRRRRRGLPRER